VTDYLKRLRETNLQTYLNTRELIDSLQEDPIPNEARSVEGQSHTFGIPVDDHEILYRVDTPKRRVDIASVQPHPN